jgi:rhomboid protease GluP
LLWKWNNFRRRMQQKTQDAGIRMRGVTAAHRMCPHCRALVPTGAHSCSECGESLAGASKPGATRLLEWAMPGISPVSAAIVTANFAIFLMLGMRAGFATEGGGGGLFGLFNLMSFDGDTLTRYGSGNNFLLIYRAEWWRLVCPIFLHGGLLHLLFNIYIFVQIAPLLEEEYGADKLFVCYMFCGVASFVASEFIRAFVFHGAVNTVGASGAIFGLVGATLVFGIRRGGQYGRALRSMMLRWTMYFLILGFLFPATDNFAHIGGLVAGAAFAAVVPSGLSRDTGVIRLWRLASILCLALAVVSFLFAGAQGLESLEWLRQQR